MRPEAGGFRAKGADFGENASRLPYSAFGHERKKTLVGARSPQDGSRLARRLSGGERIKTGWTETRRTCL